MYNEKSQIKFATFTTSSCGIPVGVGGAGYQTGAVVQGGLGVHAGITVVVVGPVAQSAVRVATQTLPSLFVLKEPLGTVEHTQALVEKVILLTACTKNSFQCWVGEQFSTSQWNCTKYPKVLDRNARESKKLSLSLSVRDGFHSSLLTAVGIKRT